MKGTCTSCDIHYTYDGFTVGGKSYRLTEERPYMMVTNRCVQRPFLRPFPRCVPTVHDICAIFRSVLRKRDIDDTEPWVAVRVLISWLLCLHWSPLCRWGGGVWARREP